MVTGYNRNITAASLTANQTYYTLTSWASGAMVVQRIETSNTHLDPVDIGELNEMNPTWLTTAAGTPSTWLQLGFGSFILYPKTSGTLSSTLYTLDKITVPTSDSDYIQVGDEDLPAIVDFATFIARLKEGGKEASESVGLIQNFLKAAAKYNANILNTSLYKKVMGQPQKQTRPASLEHMPPQ